MYRYNLIERVVRHLVMFVMFAGVGAYVLWHSVATPKRWVDWRGGKVTVEGNELIAELHYQLLQTCARVRVTAPLDVAELHTRNGQRPERIIIQLPPIPTTERASVSIAGADQARIVIPLAAPLRESQEHEITFGLVCLRDENGGSLQSVAVELFSMRFVP